MTTTSSVTSTADYAAAVEQIKAELEATYGADPNFSIDDYLAGLDGTSALNVVDDPALEAYFQLAYVQLMQILDPSLSYSLTGDISQDYLTISSSASSGMDELARALIDDDPELMALYAREAGGQSEGDYLMSYLAEAESAAAADSSSDELSPTDEARAFADEYDIPIISTYADQEDMYNAAEQSILNSLADLDEQLTNLTSQNDAGLLSDEAFSADMQSNSYSRQMYMTMLQQVNEGKMNFFELISDIMKKQSDMTMATVANWKV